METIEHTILKNLLYNEEYSRKVIPFIKPEYFQEVSQKIMFEEIVSFITKYNTQVTVEALLIEISDRKDLNEGMLKELQILVTNLQDSPADLQWLYDTTEKWCRDRAIYLALMDSINIADGNDEKKNRDAIPSILSEALAVSFDNNIGHDYFANADERFDYYHQKQDKIPFDLEYFNKITKGGLVNKSLNVALAGTGVGKSLFMCHVAGAALTQGYNVLYITCEMAEEKIAERIDANLLNVNVKDIVELPEVLFSSKVQEIAKKTRGKLIIKEYPTASAHVGHFKALLSDLKLKKDFKPDIIFVDYLNICASVRYKGAIVNSYTYVKAIAEELRGLAVECSVPIVSATQTTRSGYGNSDPDLTDTSESFGLPATADFMFALISTEELEQQGRILVKQLKNRYSDLVTSRKFMVGIDRAKMKLYDVAEDASVIGINNEDPGEDFQQFADTQSRLSKFAEWNV